MKMFNLEKSIQTWKRQLRKNPAFEDGDIAELESHLREEIERLKAKGLLAEEAFNKATETFGEPDPIADEMFKTRTKKMDATPPWKQKPWIPIMLNNYIKVALRYTRKNKGYVFINVLGLAIGLTCSIFILLYIQDELSYDTFFNEKEDIYRVVATRGGGSEISDFASTPYPLAPALKSDFPEVEEVARMRKMFKPILQAGEIKYRENWFFVADSSIFEIFDLPFHIGNVENALTLPNSLVLTQEAALRYFGDENPIGRTVTYNSGFGRSLDLTVTGVLENLPENTHLKFDFLAPIESFGGPFESWRTFVQNYTYIKLANGAAAKALEAQFPSLIERNVGDQLEGGGVFSLALQPLLSIHLHSQRVSEIQENGNINYIYFFSAIGLLILIIAAVNFMNMSTARSTERAQEVGMRKALGSTRIELIRQFMMESVMLCLFALAFALILTTLLLPYFNDITGKSFSFNLVTDVRLLVSLFGISVIVGLLAGSYPALLLSSFNPVQVLKSKTTTASSGLMLRKSLVVFQFVVTVTLLIGATVVYNQLNYIENKDLGIDPEQVVIIPIDTPTGNKADLIKEELQRNQDIINVSASMLIPSEQFWTYSAKIPGEDSGITIGFCKVDYDFFETFGIDLNAGRLFNQSFAADENSGYVINEEAAVQLGFSSAEEAIGQEIIYGGDKRGTIIGVVNNFHTSSLHTEIGPAIFFLEKEYYYLSVRINSERTEQSLEFIQTKLAELAPTLPFEYSFLDQRFEQLYNSDRKIAEVVAYFSFLAIIIACIGLFGLTAYSAQQRTREIGVRKVLGASITNIFGMLTKDFLILVVIGFVIAIPVAYFGINKWLQNFAYHIEPGVGIYLGAGIVTVLIALLTVSYQSVKAALMNPVKSLRSE